MIQANARFERGDNLIINGHPIPFQYLTQLRFTFLGGIRHYTALGAVGDQEYGLWIEEGKINL